MIGFYDSCTLLLAAGCVQHHFMQITPFIFSEWTMWMPWSTQIYRQLVLQCMIACWETAHIEAYGPPHQCTYSGVLRSDKRQEVLTTRRMSMARPHKPAADQYTTCNDVYQVCQYVRCVTKHTDARTQDRNVLRWWQQIGFGQSALAPWTGELQRQHTIVRFCSGICDTLTYTVARKQQAIRINKQHVGPLSPDILYDRQCLC